VEPLMEGVGPWISSSSLLGGSSVCGPDVHIRCSFHAADIEPDRFEGPHAIGVLVWFTATHTFDFI